MTSIRRLWDPGTWNWNMELEAGKEEDLATQQ